MKYLRLYDLRNETVTVIPYSRSRTPVTPDSAPQVVRAKKRKISKRIIRWAKHTAFTVAEVTVSLASGLVFLHFVSEKLREIRGYDAVGSEYFAAAFIAMFVFFIFEEVREWLWTRR